MSCFVWSTFAGKLKQALHSGRKTSNLLNKYHNLKNSNGSTMRKDVKYFTQMEVKAKI